MFSTCSTYVLNNEHRVQLDKAHRINLFVKILVIYLVPFFGAIPLAAARSKSCRMYRRYTGRPISVDPVP